MARVELQNVGKTFHGTDGHTVRAADGVSLVVEDKELLALVGPSACGKTTTLRLIAGLETPDTGTIHIGGKDVTAVPPQQRDVAMVFQSHALYAHLTAAENIDFGLKFRRMERYEISQRLGEIVNLLGLTECLDRKPAELSGGQRQRVALGRALIRRPQVLLMDEPFANLDAPLRRELRREVLRLHRELNLTIVLVTHDQAEALAMGQRVTVMNRGKIEQTATPAELREKPASDFVRAFLDPSLL